MKLFVVAKPNAKANSVQQIDATHFRVSVKAPAKAGKANEAIIEVLSGYFHAPKSRFSITSALVSKRKVIEPSGSFLKCPRWLIPAPKGRGITLGNPLPALLI